MRPRWPALFCASYKGINPQHQADGEEQDANHLARGARQPVAQDFEHVEGRHEVPLGVNAGGRGRERIRLFAQIHGKTDASKASTLSEISHMARSL